MVVAQVGQKLQQPLALDPKSFERAYETRTGAALHDFAERQPGANRALRGKFPRRHSAWIWICNPSALIRSARRRRICSAICSATTVPRKAKMPFSIIAAGLSRRRRHRSRLRRAIARAAGEESVLVNSLGYRQSENIWSQPEPGHNVVLTIDLDIQRAAEESLAEHQGADARAAVVVMDVRTATCWRWFRRRRSIRFSADVEQSGIFERSEIAAANQSRDLRKLRARLHFQTHRRTRRAGKWIEPGRNLRRAARPEGPRHGCIYVGARKIRDTVSPGAYNFRRAIIRIEQFTILSSTDCARASKKLSSSPKNFISANERIADAAGIAGNFPDAQTVKQSDWRDGDSANICFGQGEIAVTPMQMAVAYSAIANGGTVLWPRLVERIEPQDPASGEAATNFPAGLVRDEIGVSRAA
jgi:penicillin-binding protein 2